MTDANSAAHERKRETQDPKISQYLGAWAECMSSVLGQISGGPFPVQWVGEGVEGAPAASDSDLYAVISAASGLRGEMSLRIPQPIAVCLAQIFVGEGPDPSVAFKPEHKEAVEELLRQLAGQVATALKPHYGEVQLSTQMSAPPAWPPGVKGWLTSSQEAKCPVQIEWRLSAALVAALQSQQGGEEAHASESSAEKAPALSPADQRNLDLLMDVELALTLRFGERTLLLREILELGAGSVVELDRNVDEPVELLLDGRTIARGEVVVVDGDYGLQVTEVLAPGVAA